MKKIIISVLLLTLVLGGCSKPKDDPKPVIDPIDDKDDTSSVVSKAEEEILNKRTEFIGSSLLFTDYPNNELYDFSKEKVTQFYFIGLIADEEGLSKELGQEFNNYTEITGENMRALMKKVFNVELTEDYDMIFTSSYVKDEDVYRFPQGGIGGTGYPTPMMDEAKYKIENNDYIVEVPMKFYDGSNNKYVDRGNITVTYGKSEGNELNFYYKTAVVNLIEE